MHVDGLTLLLTGCFIAGLGGFLVLGAWLELKATTALLWWGGAHLANGAAVVLLAAGLTTGRPLAIMAGGVGIVASMTLYWSGTRVFFGRRPSSWLIGGAIAVALAMCLPFVPDDPKTAVAVACLLTAILLTAACRELIAAPDEQLKARWWLVLVFALHASFMAFGCIGLLVGAITVDATPSVVSWFGLINFERLVFLVAGALFMVVMARERSEAISTSAAHVDSLTGIANRGAFFDRAERIFRRARTDRLPLSLVAFDLDHFKVVNDTFGHAAGDRALKMFADTASELLRPSDLIGRIGGEEFVAILPGASVEAAYVVADRIRHAFAERSHAMGKAPATVSAGVAFSDGELGLTSLLEAADLALYRAKAGGRNRVERYDRSRPLDTVRQMIRVA